MLDLVRAALRQITADSGLSFTYKGTTTVKPLTLEDDYPIGVDAIIAFAEPVEDPELDGVTFGLGGFVMTASAEGPRITRGSVVLDAHLVAGLAAGFGPGPSMGGALLHELGHMVGLGHVHDRMQIMNPTLTTSAPQAYASGDRRGLALVGAAAGCFTNATSADDVALR